MQSPHLFFEGLPAPSVRTTRRVGRTLPSRTEPRAEDVGGFLGTLLGRANLRASSYRSPALQRRVAACVRFLRVKTAEEAARRIAAEPHLVQGTLNILLLGVTGFFRDALVFGQLHDVVLPSLLADRPRLRVWSAACSGGHELYSVAMLLSDLGRLEHCELLGTDCRAAAIEQARSGVFDPASLAGLDPRWRERLFVRAGSSAVVDLTLRRGAEWKVADLFTTVERGPWDLILWRNMAIYLESHVAADLWRRLVQELAPGGYIVCGKADHPPGGLPLVRRSSCIYQLIPR